MKEGLKKPINWDFSTPFQLSAFHFLKITT